MGHIAHTVHRGHRVLHTDHLNTRRNRHMHRVISRDLKLGGIDKCLGGCKHAQSTNLPETLIIFFFYMELGGVSSLNCGGSLPS